MRKLNVRILALTLLFGLVAGASARSRADLKGFMARPEPTYHWEKRSVDKIDDVTVYDLHMISQEWQGIQWDHRLMIFRPDKVEFPHHCLIYNTGGGGGSKGDMAMGAKLAKLTGATYAILFGNPKQPLYGGLTEDALIVYTWQKYMTTGDESWPLHFPMAKAVIKGMDTVQAFAKEQNWPSIDGFTINGGSKRGWTTWLVGASGDPRVKGIAPMVIDVLNVPKQMHHQMDSWGYLSEQVGDYSKGGFMQLVDSAPFQKLMLLEDPYTYREQLTMPKLIILGTNDRYWTQDSLNIYWDDLKGPKWVLYTPNSGHGLDDRERVFNTLAAFTRMNAGGKKFPKMEWEHSIGDSGDKIVLQSSITPKSARVFHNEGQKLDLRDSKWTSVEIEKVGKTTTGTHPLPASGYNAVFCEATYDLDGRPFTLSTQLRILKAKQ